MLFSYPAPFDYIEVIDGTLAFGPMAQQAYINITIVDDVLDEPTEDFIVELTSTDRAVSPLPRLIITLVDNEDGEHT